MITKSQKPRLSIQVSVPNNTQFLFWPATILMFYIHMMLVCTVKVYATSSRLTSYSWYSFALLLLLVWTHKQLKHCGKTWSNNINAMFQMYTTLK